ncbi:multidrug effflux MFS transporter [Coralliovum pocilloporae]|uniref:multidrug effflux MFS transporter n=1 Tax=Coralliovum pocilloporae TaxID=3066369 RepID=UPI0033076AAA
MSVSAPTPGGIVRRPSILVLVAVTAVNPLAMNIFVPSMPGMADFFGTTYSMVQLTLSVYLGAICICQLIVGPLADRFGRRPVILWGFVLFLIGTLICLFSGSIEMLIFGRLVQGSGGAVGIVLSRTIIRDVYDNRRSASMIGYVTMGMAVAPLIGPAIGGFLDELYGWQAAFELVLAFGGLTLIAVFLTLVETRPASVSARSMATILKEWGHLFTYARYWAFSGSTSFTTSVFFAFLGAAPYVCNRIYGMTPSEYGLYFCLLPGGYIIGNFLSGRFAEHAGLHRMMLTGNMLCLAGVGISVALIAGGSLHPMALFGPLVLTSIANGMVLPSATAGAISVRPDLAGSASGMTGSLQVGGGMIFGIIAGTAVEAYASIWPLLIVLALVTVLGTLCSLWSRALEPRETAEASGGTG